MPTTTPRSTLMSCAKIRASAGRAGARVGERDLRRPEQLGGLAHRQRHVEAAAGGRRGRGGPSGGGAGGDREGAGAARLDRLAGRDGVLRRHAVLAIVRAELEPRAGLHAAVALQVAGEPRCAGRLEAWIAAAAAEDGAHVESGARLAAVALGALAVAAAEPEHLHRRSAGLQQPVDLHVLVEREQGVHGAADDQRRRLDLADRPVAGAAVPEPGLVGGAQGAGGGGAVVGGGDVRDRVRRSALPAGPPPSPPFVALASPIE